MPIRFCNRPSDRLSTCLIVLATLLFLPGPVFAANWKQSLEESLKAEYRPTKVGIPAFQFDHNRITEPGAVLVVRIPGIYADVADPQQAIVKTKILNGEAVQQKGVLASLAFTKQSRQLIPALTQFSRSAKSAVNLPRFC